MEQKWFPKYFCVDTRAARLVARLPPEARLQFYDGVYSAFTCRVEDAEILDFPDTFEGDLTRQAVETMLDCFETYRRRAFANPGGKKKGADQADEQEQPTGNPLGSQWVGNDLQQTSSSCNESPFNDSSIFSALQAEGYSEQEIRLGLLKISGRPGIKDVPSYLRKVLDEMRKRPGKTVTAQQYTQRSYAGEQEDAMARMIQLGQASGVI